MSHTPNPQRVLCETEYSELLILQGQLQKLAQPDHWKFSLQQKRINCFLDSGSANFRIFCNLNRLKISKIIKSWFPYAYYFFPQFVSFFSHLRQDAFNIYISTKIRFKMIYMWCRTYWSQTNSQKFLEQNGFTQEQQRIAIWGVELNGKPSASPEKWRRGTLLYGLGKGRYKGIPIWRKIKVWNEWLFMGWVMVFSFWPSYNWPRKNLFFLLLR